MLNKNDEDPIEKLVEITNIMIFDAYTTIKYYRPIFER